MSEELWHFIPEYDKRYAISNHGRVLNVETKRYLKRVPNGGGYCTVNLSEFGISICYTIHRLVAEAFFEEYKPALEVAHYDGDKTNNRPENLYHTKRKIRGRG